MSKKKAKRRVETEADLDFDALREHFSPSVPTTLEAARSQSCRWPWLRLRVNVCVSKQPSRND